MLWFQPGTVGDGTVNLYTITGTTPGLHVDTKARLKVTSVVLKR